MAKLKRLAIPRVSKDVSNCNFPIPLVGACNWGTAFDKRSLAHSYTAKYSPEIDSYLPQIKTCVRKKTSTQMFFATSLKIAKNPNVQQVNGWTRFGVLIGCDTAEQQKGIRYRYTQQHGLTSQALCWKELAPKQYLL